MQKLSVKNDEKWFHQIPVECKNKGSPSKELVSSLRAEAQNHLESETKLYHRFKGSNKDKDFAWISKILTTGTLSDKISAHTVLIQDSAIYNIKSIETLIGMVNTKGKRECLMVMGALPDLLISDLLIDSRKLKPFNERPLENLDDICNNNPAVRRKLLILWLFEDNVKELYKKFLSNIDVVSRDTIESTKMKAVSVMAKLLKENPEQEQWLLEHLVNKIGDPIPKVGSHTCYLLGSVLSQHTNMKGILIDEVERFIFRLNLPDRVKYYALCFLNQILLNEEDVELANHLINIYFCQFKYFVKKGDVDTKIMSALLTGVARAYPYAKLKDNVIITELDAMYKLVHVVSFNISVQALMLIFQVLDSTHSVSDRFYSALYRKLLDPALGTTSKPAFLLNLVYKAIKKDVAIVRVKAFVKRLLQISLSQAPNLQCGILVLISEVINLYPSLMDITRLYQEDSDSEEHFVDAPEEEEEEVIEKKIHVLKKESKPNKKNKSAYDFNCRNPLFSNALTEHLWELGLLRQSFHPSVSLFANQVSQSIPIKYNGDPLLDFTTIRFLDRFVYRNPKKPTETLQSNPTFKVFGSRKFKAAYNALPAVNSQEFIQKNIDKIPIQEKFIYNYLKNRTLGKKPDKHEDSDMESVCSEDFDNLLDGVHPESDSNFLNFEKELNTRKRKKKADSDSDEDDDSLPSLDYDEEDFEDIDMDDEENNEDFEDDFIPSDANTRKKGKKGNKNSFDDTELLASAEKFSTLLEDDTRNKIDMMSGHAFKVDDKTSAKQIAWEIQRDRYVKGKKYRKRQNFGKKFKK